MPALATITTSSFSSMATEAFPSPFTPEPAPGETPGPCYDAIALKAYFIALDRHARGEEADPLKDWLEAERLLKTTGSDRD